MSELDKETRAMIFRGIASLKSEACLDNARLGRYLEGRISAAEISGVENHLDRCLYCLNRLTEIRELVFLERFSKPLTAEQVRRFTRTIFSKTGGANSQSVRRAGFTMNWRLSAGLSFIMVIFLGSMFATIKVKNPEFFSSRKSALLTAEAETNIRKSGVKVDLLDSSGKAIQTIPGVVIDSRGLILANLKDLKKADSARVNLSDGTSSPVIGVQIDRERNLAILKVSQNNLVPVKLSSRRTLQVGEKVIHIPDPTDPISTASHVVITQVSAPNPEGGKKHQNIEISGQTPIISKGILVNLEGETVGKVIGGDGVNGSAVTLDSNESFGDSGNFISISLIEK